MTLKEAAAMKHFMSSSRFPQILFSEDKKDVKNLLLEKGWISNDKEVIELLKDGILQFRQNTALRILKENESKIYFNYCPKCSKLARTPQAKQCRFCAFSWHNQAVASFKIASILYLQTRDLFFILGDILTGTVYTGLKVDLTVIGLAIKPTIRSIEFVKHSDDGIDWENVGLGLIGLSEYEREFLQNTNLFSIPIPIEAAISTNN